LKLLSPFRDQSVGNESRGQQHRHFPRAVQCKNWRSLDGLSETPELDTAK